MTRDLTEQHDLELRLRASEERFRLLVGQVQDYAIIALDPQGVIETWNLGAERVKGYTAEEAIGRSFAMFYTPEDRRSGLPLRLLAQARDTGRVEHNGWRVRKDGTTFWGDIVITAITTRTASSPVTPRSPATAPTSRHSRTPRTPSTRPSPTTSGRRSRP